jgi:hypothetical protein
MSKECKNSKVSSGPHSPKPNIETNEASRRCEEASAKVKVNKKSRNTKFSKK